MARKATKATTDDVIAEASKAKKTVRRAASSASKAVAAKVPAAPKRASVAKAIKTVAGASAAKARKAKAEAPKAAAALTVPVARASAKARKAMKSAKDEALNLVPSTPSSSPVSDTVKALGNQIVGALNSDIGRVMVAELLVYVAKSLTSAAAKTEAAGDAKSAILNAGAKLGAVAAGAGAKLVDTGHAAASGGAKLLEDGRHAAEAGLEAATKGASNASDLMREVAHVAVGAVGGVVADTATKLLKRGASAAPKVAALAPPKAVAKAKVAVKKAV